MLITNTPELNVPEAVRSGLMGVLKCAVNATNRANKEAKFCFETSEDAVTWTIFRGLQQAGRLGALIPRPPEGVPAMLLWGAPVGERATEASAALRSVCLSLGEDERRLTEPDAILIWDNLLVFVEAKYRSPNDRKAPYPNFERYTAGKPGLFAVPPGGVAENGFYELTRNWRVGLELCQHLGLPDFLLVNLGGPALAESAAEFARAIRQTERRRFCHRRWAEVLEQAAPLEPWLAAYADAKRLHRN